jgi:hypothetical protein
MLDDIEQSNATLVEAWPLKTNIFIGSELTPTPNADYDGTIADVSLSGFLSLAVVDNRQGKWVDDIEIWISRSPNVLRGF